jgi:hypothetical protein
VVSDIAKPCAEATGHLKNFRYRGWRTRSIACRRDFNLGRRALGALGCPYRSLGDTFERGVDPLKPPKSRARTAVNPKMNPLRHSDPPRACVSAIQGSFSAYAMRSHETACAAGHRERMRRMDRSASFGYESHGIAPPVRTPVTRRGLPKSRFAGYVRFPLPKPASDARYFSSSTNAQVPGSARISCQRAPGP